MTRPKKSVAETTRDPSASGIAAASPAKGLPIRPVVASRIKGVLVHTGADGIARPVPWVTKWSGETEETFRFCRFANARAQHFPHRPGNGQPKWREVHAPRQRRAARHGLCVVCGEPCPPEDRWVFPNFAHVLVMGPTGSERLIFEGVVHRACGLLTERMCPFISDHGFRAARLPSDFKPRFVLEEMRARLGASVREARSVAVIGLALPEVIHTRLMIEADGRGNRVGQAPAPGWEAR